MEGWTLDESIVTRMKTGEVSRDGWLKKVRQKSRKQARNSAVIEVEKNPDKKKAEKV